MPGMESTDQPDPLLVALGQRIRSLRRATGRSQEDLAHVAEVHRTYWSDLERGTRNPTVTTLARVAKALGVSLPELLISAGDSLTIDAASEREVMHE